VLDRVALGGCSGGQDDADAVQHRTVVLVELGADERVFESGVIKKAHENLALGSGLVRAIHGNDLVVQPERDNVADIIAVVVADAVEFFSELIVGGTAEIPENIREIYLSIGGRGSGSVGTGNDHCGKGAWDFGRKGCVGRSHSAITVIKVFNFFRIKKCRE